MDKPWTGIINKCFLPLQWAGLSLRVLLVWWRLSFSDKTSSWDLLTFKIKLPVILPAKVGLFGNGKGLQLGTCKLWQNHRQAHQTNKRNVILQRRRRKLAGGQWCDVGGGGSGYFEQNLLEKSQSSGWWLFPLTELQRWPISYRRYSVASPQPPPPPPTSWGLYFMILPINDMKCYGPPSSFWTPL